MVFIIKMYFMSSLLCVRVSRLLRFPQLGGLGSLLWKPVTPIWLHGSLFAALNRHIGRHSSRSGCCRNSSRDCVSSLWSLHVNDPVAQEKLIGLGKDAVRNRHAALLSTRQRCLDWHGQSLGADKLSGCRQLRTDGLQDCHACISILLGPSKIALPPLLSCRSRAKGVSCVPS